MHPTLYLCIWLCVVLVLQWIPAAAAVAAGALALVLATGAARRRWLVLLSRSRWLLAVLFLSFVLLTPGESVWPGLPVTLEGARRAGEQAVRLVLVLFAVAWLLAAKSTDELVAAMWGFAGTLRAESLQKAILRLALTLECVASAPDQREPLMTTLRNLPAPSAPLAAATIILQVRPLTPIEIVGALLCFAASAWLCWSWA